MRKFLFLFLINPLISQGRFTLPSRDMSEILKKDIKVRKHFIPYYKNIGQHILERKELMDKGLLPLKKQADTAVIHILAIRVAFEREDPDDPFTTGDGWFDLVGNRDSIGDTNSIFYDPPHNKKYFENYLKSLKNYISAISYGKIKLEYTVKPDSSDSFYVLPHLMRYYGDTLNFDIGLVQLFQDALIVADQDSTVDFDDLNSNGIKDYQEGIKDVIMIFHAGSTWQTDVLWNTPFDIATVTIPQGALQYYLGEPFVYLNQGKDSVSGGIILPETGDQDGLITSLNGLMFHEFGHDAFYLTDLYHIYGMSTGVGAWDVMGSGGWAEMIANKPDGDTARVSGVVPTFYSAWTRLWTDWTLRVLPERYFDPEEWEDPYAPPLWGFGFLDGLVDSLRGTGPDTTLIIYPAGVKITDTNTFLPPPNIPGPRIVYVPIDYREYFLIEYRQNNLFGEEIPLYIKNGVALSPFGAYDNSLPGQGLLIWHIDENIVYNYYWEINSNNVHKGVDLEEADGIQDLDKWTDYPYTWFGSPYDPYYKGNNRTFGPETDPNSKSWSGGNSGIEISGVRNAGDTVMIFGLSRKIYLRNFPETVDKYWTLNGNYFKETFINFIDIDSDGKGEFLCTGSMAFDFYGDTLDTTSYFYILKDDATPYGGTPYLVFRTDKIPFPPVFDNLDGTGSFEGIFVTDQKLYIYRLNTPSPSSFLNFPRSSYPPFTSPATLFDINGDSLSEILISGSDGFLYLIDPRDSLNDRKSIYLGSSTRGAPAVFKKDGEIYIVLLTQDGKIHLLNESLNERNGFPVLGPTLLSSQTTPVVADFDADGEFEIFVIRGDGSAFFVSINGQVEAQKSLGGGNWTSPGVSDWDGDGFLEVFFAGNKRLYGLNHTGSFVTGFPIKIKEDTLLSPYSSPLLFQIEEKTALLYPDGLSSSLVLSNLNSHPYFPIFTGTLGTSQILTKDANGDSLFDLMLFSRSGVIHAIQPEITETYWSQYAKDDAHTSFFAGARIPNPLQKPVSLYLYPSIVRGDKATVRLYSLKPGELSLQVWSFAGLKLKELNFSVKGKDFEEWTIDLKDLASGPYILRWNLKGNKGNFKFSVVR